MAVAQENINDVLKAMKAGVTLYKYMSSRRIRPRRFYLHEYEGYISYDQSQKICGGPTIYHIIDIRGIIPGLQGQKFNELVRQGIAREEQKACAFSIIYGDNRRAVHLMAPDNTIQELWIRGLRYLMKKYKNKNQGDLIQEENWILQFFHGADKDKSNTLTKQECQALLMNTLNVEMPDSVFEQMFKKVHGTSEGALSPEEFVNFFQLLTRRKDLYDIMLNYVKNGTKPDIDNIHLNKLELLSFIQQNKYENLKHIEDENQIQNMINKYEINTAFRDKGLISLDGFRNMLLSQTFNIIDLSKINNVYQDMTRYENITNRYVTTISSVRIIRMNKIKTSLIYNSTNSLHCRLLLSNQKTSYQGSQLYDRALSLGCKAIDFDCYDGLDEPIIKHADTLGGSYSFEAVLRNITPDLFKNSP
ncbi:unnamed protein product [Rotaria sp. Silwood1]|nr:unnamed protein product [Rotaria sp. Silwood1]CAF4980596.1 unnamed protein product [Rotaria sp. Silwood1]